MEINRSVQRAHRRRLWGRRLPKLLILGACIGFLGNSVLDYLANLPRERFAKGYKFLERVWLGTETVARMSALKLAAHHADFKNTKLPVAEIYIRGARYDKLVEALPNTDVSPEKADLQFGGRSFKGKVRFKGDSINHWAYPSRSWRVELKDTKSYRGMRTFNLNVPRVNTQISNWLGYRIAKEFDGLLVPYAENYQFRLNRQFDGIRLLLEQPNQEFLTQRFLPPGKIFVGDISTDQIYGNTPRKYLYSDVTGWEVRAPANDIGNRELSALLNTLQNDANPYEFYESIRSIVDVRALTNYMALLELVGTVHVDETHNGKLYFNPHTGRFSPIVWDTVAYMWGNRQGLDLATNRLFRVVLSNPQLRFMKDQALWKALTGGASTEKL
ncbi:MAG: CotH kinase family protein, partial [Bdellovibrionales bacterium]|nr:CotH kinase family protein [Bdellovibrionales bacterium]